MKEKKVSYFNIILYYFLITVVFDLVSSLVFSMSNFDLRKSLLLFIVPSLTLLPIYYFYKARSLFKRISMGEGLALTIFNYALDLIILGLVFLIAKHFV